MSESRKTELKAKASLAAVKPRMSRICDCARKFSLTQALLKPKVMARRLEFTFWGRVPSDTNLSMLTTHVIGSENREIRS